MLISKLLAATMIAGPASPCGMPARRGRSPPRSPLTSHGACPRLPPRRLRGMHRLRRGRAGRAPVHR